MEEAHEDYQKDGEAFETEEKRKGILVTVVKVMTEDQIETLRKQIAAYTIISEQLQKTYDALSTQYLAESSSFCNFNGDHYLRSTGSKISRRHRWTPSPSQFEILERVFEDCNGNPGKQKIKDIALDLSQYGQVSESSVYNWFQNRRARCKRMKSEGAEEAEGKKEAAASTRRKRKSTSGLGVESRAMMASTAGNHCFESVAEMGNEMLPSDYFGLASSESFGCGSGWGDKQFEGEIMLG